MWVQLHTSVQPVRSLHREGPHLPSFGTVRQIRSAASQYLACSWMTERQGGELYFQDKRLLQGPVRLTDGAPYEFFSRGLQARMGDHTTPSTALLARHVRGLNAYFEAKHLGAQSTSERQDYALAGLANLLLWTSWLRGG